MWQVTLIVFSALIIFLIFYRRYQLIRLNRSDVAAQMAAEHASGLTGIAHDIADNIKFIITAGRSNPDGDQNNGTTGSLNLASINQAFRKGDMHFSRGDLNKAEKWFIKVLSHHDTHHEALNRLGVIYIQTKRPGKAELLFRKLLSSTQKEPVYYSNFGRCLYNLQRLEEACEAYKQAIKLDATRAARYISLGQIYYELNDYEGACACFKKAVKLEPGNGEFLELYAHMLEQSGQKEELKKCLLKLVEINPYNEELKQKLAELGE